MESVFEEWSAYAARKELLSRVVDFDSIISNSKSKIVAITGVRRVGKSSVLMLLLQKLLANGEKVCYVNLEDSRLKSNPHVLDDVIKWFGDQGFVLLDEITSSLDWEGWLARTHELLKGKLRLIVSSSRKNLVWPCKPLRGRILAFELYPLPFNEFLNFKGIQIEKTTAGRGRLEKAFMEYLKYGGFPEVVLVKEEIDKVRILNSYFKDIVGLDVAELSNEDVSIVETFGRYVVQSPYFSASKCLNFLKTLGYKIGKDKILQLEHYSQASYLFFFIEIFAYNIKDRSQYPRKAYPGDTGFSYSTIGKINLGRLYENLVFLELKRRLGGQREICYWKNREGKEVDFLIKQGTNINQLTQVVYDLCDEKTLVREKNAILKCAKEFKVKKAIIFTKDVSQTETIDGITISFVPLIDWLLTK
ncbi:MAG: ATP-binding protein [Candidatus Micrarchaeota archaeon]